MSQNAHAVLRCALVEVTRKGRVQDWVERIAAVATIAGLRLESIQWQGSPEKVASNVVETAGRLSMLDLLEHAINNSE